MGLLDDLNGAWHAIEGVGKTVFHDIEDVVGHLASLGVPSFPSLKSFIEFLVGIGENPFTFIPRMVSEIVSRGGSVVDTLEEVASGFIHEGPQNYVSRLTRQKIDPIIHTVQQHTQTAKSLGSLHQSTLTQVRTKLMTLSQGGNGTIPFQGKAADAIQTHFTTISSNINKLIAPMTGGGSESLGYDTADPWASFQDSFDSINQTFIDGLNEIPNIVRSFSHWELALVAIAFVVGLAVAVETAGVGDVVDLGVTVVAEVVLLLVEIAVIAVWFVGDCLLWLGRVIVALIVLGVEEIIYHLSSHSTAHSSAIPYPNEWVLPDGTPLPKELIPRAKELWDLYKGKIKALTGSIVAYLALYCSRSMAQKLLDEWDKFGPILEQLGSPDPGKVLEAEALINAIIQIGPQNVQSLGFPYKWTNPDGSPVLNQGKPKIGDIDIVTKYNPPWYVEVGSYNKINKKGFREQLIQLKRYAESQKPPGTAKFYMQMPAVPMTASQAKDMGETLTLARQILDGKNIPTTVDPTTGEIIPPLNTRNVVVMRQPDSKC